MVFCLPSSIDSFFHYRSMPRELFLCWIRSTKQLKVSDFHVLKSKMQINGDFLFVRLIRRFNAVNMRIVCLFVTCPFQCSFSKKHTSTNRNHSFNFFFIFFLCVCFKVVDSFVFGFSIVLNSFFSVSECRACTIFRIMT